MRTAWHCASLGMCSPQLSHAMSMSVGLQHITMPIMPVSLPLSHCPCLLSSHPPPAPLCSGNVCLCFVAGLLVWAHIPGREFEYQSALVRILDGGARGGCGWHARIACVVTWHGMYELPKGCMLDTHLHCMAVYMHCGLRSIYTMQMAWASLEDAMQLAEGCVQARD